MEVDGSLLGAVQQLLDDGQGVGLLLIDESYEPGAFVTRVPGVGLAHQSRPRPGMVGEKPSDWQVKNVRYHQQRVIQFCSTMGIPAWLVEIYHGNRAGQLPSRLSPHVSSETTTKLRALLPPTTTMIRKGRFNAFDDDARPDLHESLGNQGVQNLIVMGFSSQMCVHYTVVGGRKIPKDGKCPGALTLGYHVLSSGLLTWPKPIPWTEDEGVSFYSRL